MTRRGWLLFTVMCVVWGVPYLLIKVAVREFSPAELVFVRTALAALILLPIALLRGEVRGALRHWRPLVVYTLVEIAAPWLLLTDAERYASSSLCGLVIAGVPLVAALVMRLTDARERLAPQRVIGLLIGIAGVGTLLGFDSNVPGLVPIAELLGVVICYAVGPIIAGRWLSDAPNLGVAATSLALCALLYAPVALPGSASLVSRVTLGAGFAAVALAVVCTALAFVFFFALIAEVGPARATVFTFINPAVAVALGAAVLDEPVTPVTALAFVLVLVGSVLATRRERVEVAAGAAGCPTGPAPVAEFEAGRSEAARSEAARSEAARSEAARSEAAPSDATPTDTAPTGPGSGRPGP